MDQLGKTKIRHTDIFDKDIATHVVTGVVYGQEAYFVFERQMTESEKADDVNGNMEGVLKVFPSFAIEGIPQVHIHRSNM